ncbi:MAG: phosphoribosylanthranilate isomerase [bacterium]|nr:phosphoribosylanthranilate isomerase [bacterium]
MVKIKICGITCAQDATWAANLGADFIGLNFFKDSPRKISPQNALEILKEIPPFVSSVGVFVNEDIKNIVKLVKKLSLSLVQLHGEETVEYCRQIKEAVPGIKIIKAFRIKDETVFDSMRPYLEIADYFLLDVYVEGIAGGTGATFNWDLALKAKELGKPIFLAGGLTPENVQEAVDKAKPFAADVASGIERSPKRKDYDKMKDFINKAKSRI